MNNTSLLTILLNELLHQKKQILKKQRISMNDLTIIKLIYKIFNYLEQAEVENLIYATYQNEKDTINKAINTTNQEIDIMLNRIKEGNENILNIVFNAIKNSEEDVQECAIQLLQRMNRQKTDLIEDINDNKKLSTYNKEEIINRTLSFNKKRLQCFSEKNFLEYLSDLIPEFNIKSLYVNNKLNIEYLNLILEVLNHKYDNFNSLIQLSAINYENSIDYEETLNKINTLLVKYQELSITEHNMKSVEFSLNDKTLVYTYESTTPKSILNKLKIKLTKNKIENLLKAMSKVVKQKYLTVETILQSDNSINDFLDTTKENIINRKNDLKNNQKELNEKIPDNYKDIKATNIMPILEYAYKSFNNRETVKKLINLIVIVYKGELFNNDDYEILSENEKNIVIDYTFDYIDNKLIKELKKDVWN